MTETNFKSVKFMTAEEKEAILRGWKRFIKSGFDQRFFTKRLYKHLTLHCSFIAHYDKAGFYSTYFHHPEDAVRFIKQFDKDFDYISTEYGMDYWIKGDFRDLNLAMCKEMEKSKKELYKRLQEKTKQDILSQIHLLQNKYDRLVHRTEGDKKRI